MNKKMIGIGGAVVGTIGAAVATAMIIKKKRKNDAVETPAEEEQLAEEVTDDEEKAEQQPIRIKQHYNVVRHKPSTADVEKSEEIIKDMKYGSKHDFTSHEVNGDINDKPYVIDRFHYGEMESEGYDAVTWKLYSSGDVTDERNELVDAADIEKYIGLRNISDLGEDSDEYNDSVYIRNDALKIDFEVEYIPYEYDDFE